MSGNWSSSRSPSREQSIVYKQHPADGAVRRRRWQASGRIPKPLSCPESFDNFIIANAFICASFTNLGLGLLRWGDRIAHELLREGQGILSFL